MTNKIAEEFMRRFVIVLSAVVILLSSILFSGCGQSETTLREIKPSAEDEKVVGTVGDYEIFYDELRFLVLNFRASLENKYGEDIFKNDPDKAYVEELSNDVLNALKVNSAALTVAKRYEITPDSESVKDYVKLQLEALASEFAEQLAFDSDEDGTPSSDEINRLYKEYLAENNLTDRYNRFVFAVDGCVSALVEKLTVNGTIPNDDETVGAYIRENFVRTLHVYIRNDEKDDVAANRRIAEECLDDLRSGRKTISELIGSVYNEDLTLTSKHGFYFTKGEFSEEYETAAFGIGIGEYSDIVETASGFYIIQRLELEDDYIEAHFEDLKTKYRYAYVNDMIAECRDGLEFVPSDYAKNLSLSEIN